jgi:CMP-N,N'-diacetyllegionaminic acid synthase
MGTLAIIPARGGSKGIPRKNIKEFNGKPLISYTISAALGSVRVDKVIVSTDDDEIARVANSCGAEVPFKRPAEISKDSSTDHQFLKHAVEWFRERGEIFETIVFLRPTNIFRTSEDIDNAILKLSESSNDSVRGVSKAVYSPYWMKKLEGDRLVPFLESEYTYARRQLLPEVFQGNGTVEVLKSDLILNQENFYGDNIGYLKMDDISAIDIDTPLDFAMAEFLHSRFWK